MKGIKLYKTSFVLLLLLTGLTNLSGQGIPEKPSPPRLVNDFTGILNSQEISSLERKLVEFSDSTSTQIAIVIVSDLAGYDREEYAQRLGEKWGVGQKGFDNGLVLLVRTSKGTSGGEIFIKPGYGLEGAIPDIICRQIVDDEIIPSFRKGDYYGGLDQATNTLISLARGEFTAGQYGNKSGKAIKKAAPIGGFLIIVIIIIILISSGKSNHNNLSKGGGLPFWLLLAMMNSGRSSHSGSWGGFSGGGGFGGGGGGFGGFGGGSFGGGGAGGSW